MLDMKLESFCCLLNFESSFNDLNDTVLQVKTAISSTKNKTKQQRKYLI